MYSLSFLRSVHSFFCRKLTKGSQMFVREKGSHDQAHRKAIQNLLYSCAGLVCSLWLTDFSYGAVSISVPASLQSDFIASTTNQWEATVKPGLFAGDSKVTITAKKVLPAPEPIADASAINALLAFGVGHGMDLERYANIQQLYGLQSREALGGTCGGVSVDLLTSTASVQMACMQAYNVAVSTITQRWGYIFTPEGQVVGP